MNILTERLGMPTLRWPKHEGHLKHKDRIALVAFLACNGITQDEIMRLRAEMDIILTDKKAERAAKDATFPELGCVVHGAISPSGTLPDHTTTAPVSGSL